MSLVRGRWGPGRGPTDDDDDDDDDDDGGIFASADFKCFNHELKIKLF